jgi:pimeloyl-ACP methyl ester carboxylesterase
VPDDARPLFDAPVRLERDFEVGGVRLHVHDWPGAAGPLVCLPSLGASGRAFDRLAAALAPAWRVLAPDPRGRGHSSAPRHGYGYQVHAADTMALLDQLGFERSVLLGVGFGALVGTLLAAWYPTRVEALVVVRADDAPGGEPSDALRQDVRAYRDCPPDLAALHAALGCPTLVVPEAEDPVGPVRQFLHALRPAP